MERTAWIGTLGKSLARMLTLVGGQQRLSTCMYGIPDFLSCNWTGISPYPRVIWTQRSVRRPLPWLLALLALLFGGIVFVPALAFHFPLFGVRGLVEDGLDKRLQIIRPVTSQLSDRLAAVEASDERMADIGEQSQDLEQARLRVQVEDVRLVLLLVPLALVLV